MAISGILFIIVLAARGCELFSFFRVSSRCGSLREVLKMFCSTYGSLGVAAGMGASARCNRLSATSNIFRGLFVRVWATLELSMKHLFCANYHVIPINKKLK
jgi:hypothetical protein